jgi:hypothetical protein
LAEEAEIGAYKLTEDSHEYSTTLPYMDRLRKPAFNFGRAMSHSFSGLFRSIVPVLICALIISTLGAVVLLACSAITETGPKGVASAYIEPIIGFLTSSYLMFLGCLFYGFCMDVSYRNLLGLRVEMKDSLRRSLPHALPLMVIAILFWLGFLLGYMAFFIPALILSAGWALPGPVYRCGDASIFGSFGRSWQLTKGYKWPVWSINFVIGLIAQLALVVVFLLIVAVLALFQETGLTTDPDSNSSQIETAFEFLLLLFVIYLVAGLYASMKAAIYAECVDLQAAWHENLTNEASGLTVDHTAEI